MSENESPQCPKCNSSYSYFSGSLWICPECAHEWIQSKTSPFSENERESSEEKFVVCDANGNILNDGDSITVIKDLKIKGSSTVVKVGSKAKNIHLVDSSDGHNIACKIEGIGQINLKSEFVKKS
ncbi:MAG: zinc ribbon domain-containing protein YjdM [Bacteriovoracaceae bacterium]|nr:zinc ribbon domain-containing protein YjdM [Bacteriovoracaceae bacterium]